MEVCGSCNQPTSAIFIGADVPPLCIACLAKLLAGARVEEEDEPVTVQ